jgi:cytochrome c
MSRLPAIIFKPASVIVLCILSGAGFWLSFTAVKEDPSIAIKPDDNRFTKTILTEKLDEPMEMTFLPDGRILFIERKGNLKAYDPKTAKVKVIAKLPVNTIYTNKKGQKREAEEGLMGVIVHPEYEKNFWIYMYYADSAEAKHVLARWELRGDKLIKTSKKILLEIPTQREECCHTGGGMVFDKQGNLFLTVGNNTVNPQSGTSNLDERKGMENSDDQRTGGNTNDLRGKILRIHPEDNGTYTIPEGNLFPKGTPKTRPEIYTMGHRNPWRPSIDSKTGYLYWGEVGPDASNDTEFGPRGYDEFNQAKGPGNFGWPYFIGDNKPYNHYDYETKKAGAPFDVAHPVNNSPNNTGLNELPPPQKAMIWYPYGMSEEFPLLGSSGRSATGGPVYRRADFPKAKRPFPAYYEGKWLIVEFMRGWIMAVTMDENGNYKSMERFLPNENFSSAIDMDFSPEGDLYILEYGTAWFKGNDNARLVKIEYNAGNRKPKVEAAADKTGGALPFNVNLTSKGTVDYDGDKLTYEWKVAGAGIIKVIKQPDAAVKLDKPGIYKATLTVTDAQGAKSSKTIELKAGNEPPQVSFDMGNANRTFYFPDKSFEYTVKVKDKEDGSLENGKIKPSQVAVTIDYLPIGYDQIEIAQLQREADKGAMASTGQLLIAKNDCKACHVKDKKSIGPSYVQVARKYKSGTAAVTENLAKKIINGGVGVWGEHAMSAHPQISLADAKNIVQYILTIEDKKEVKSQPLKGTYTTKYPEGAKDKGTFVLRAAYRDKGTATMGPLSGEEILVLRHPQLNPELADFSKGVSLQTTLFKAMYMTGDGAYVGYKNIDLTGIAEISLTVSASQRIDAAGGIIEIHLDSAAGEMIGKSGLVAVKEGRNVQIITITPVSGKRDVYFVFRNEKAVEGRILMQVSAIEVKQGK